jgi:hypothetical protein
MIFAHAPVIFPAIARVEIPFRRRFYAHVALLHGGLALRIAGDLSSNAGARAWGGMIDAVAVAVFLASTALSALAARLSRS